MKNFGKAILYIKTEQAAKFKEVLPVIIVDKTTPEEVKNHLKQTLQSMPKK